MHFVNHAVTSQLGEQTACFSMIAGSTHIVDALPAAVLAYIDDNPGTSVGAICAYLEGEMGEAILRSTVESVLKQLLDVRLIGLSGSEGN